MRSTRAVVATFGLAAWLMAWPTPAAATAGVSGEVAGTGTSPSGVVINELAPSGPGGSTDEFLELRNTSNQLVALDGWDLWACLSDGFPVLLATFASTVVIGPGGHLLLAHASSTGPSPDLTYGGWDVPDDGGWVLSDPRSGRFDGIGLRQGGACNESDPAPKCDWVAGGAVARDEQGNDTDDNAADFTCQPGTPGF